MIPRAEVRVSLVGAGPGDPELLTLGALRRLRLADVVLHDALVTPEILALCSPGARRIDVGKRGGREGASQEWITALLVSEARAGRRVVRLKGGDPYLFGRGGEEALALTRAGIPWEVVPGVSSALGVPARAGIPITHRGVSSSVAIVTGHLAVGAEAIDWAGLAGAQTLVVLMGAEHVAEICSALLASGRLPDTPVAIVQRGTLPDQQTVVSTLAALARTGSMERLARPALLVIGEVVKLAVELDAWRDTLLTEEGVNARPA